VKSRNRGFLDIHGRPRKTVWTHLASSSLAGCNTIVTDDAVDFVPGDKLVVTSSSSDFRQTEEVTVVSLAADNRTITVTPAFKFNHISTFFDVVGERVHLRCEVGLLSRNVIIQGDDESDRQLYDAHTIAARGGTFRYLFKAFTSTICLSSIIMLSFRVNNAELRECGQSFNLGRYCLHFHMVSDRPQNYFGIYRSCQNLSVTYPCFCAADTTPSTTASNAPLPFTGVQQLCLPHLWPQLLWPQLLWPQLLC
jgi:hypothetical protein